VIDKTVGSLSFPTDCTLVAIVRDKHVIAPKGETSLHAGDEVLALCSPEAEPELLNILASRG
jgi:trk system potassium uptake protein TrkA